MYTFLEKFLKVIIFLIIQFAILLFLGLNPFELKHFYGYEAISFVSGIALVEICFISAFLVFKKKISIAIFTSAALIILMSILVVYIPGATGYETIILPGILGVGALVAGILGGICRFILDKYKQR